MSITNVPATIKDPQLRLFLQQVAESIRGTERWRQDVITRREMALAGMVDKNTGKVVSPEIYDPDLDYRDPPKPTGFDGRGTFSSVILRWDPWGPDNRHVSHVEIWRAEEDDVEKAVLRGTATGAIYADPAEEDQTYFYWIRAVSYARPNDPGPWARDSGLEVSTARDPARVLELLEGQITSSQLHKSLNERITSGEEAKEAVLEQAVQIDGLNGQLTVKFDANGHVAGFGLATTVNEYDESVHSAFQVSVDTFAITKPGTTSLVFGVDTEEGMVVMDGAHIKKATIGDVQIKNVAAEKLFALEGNIAEVIIGEGHITNAMIAGVLQSDNYVPGESGWRLTKGVGGGLEANNAVIRGTIYATQGRFSGEVNATDLRVGNVIKIGEGFTGYDVARETQTVGGVASVGPFWGLPVPVVTHSVTLTRDEFVDVFWDAQLAFSGYRSAIARVNVTLKRGNTVLWNRRLPVGSLASPIAGSGGITRSHDANAQIVMSHPDWNHTKYYSSGDFGPPMAFRNVPQDSVKAQFMADIGVVPPFGGEPLINIIEMGRDGAVFSNSFKVPAQAVFSGMGIRSEFDSRRIENGIGIRDNPGPGVHTYSLEIVLLVGAYTNVSASARASVIATTVWKKI